MEILTTWNKKNKTKRKDQVAILYVGNRIAHRMT